MSPFSVRRELAVPLLLALATGLGACTGDEAAPESGEEGTPEGTPEQLRSGPQDRFELIEHDGATYGVGHGVLFTVPSEWVEYEPEQEGPDGKSLEWAVGQPADTEPVPAGLQLSMAAPGKKGRTQVDPLEANTAIAELAPKYRLLDSGKAEVEGAAEARFLRYEREIRIRNRQELVEQASLFLRTGRNRWSTIRFIAPAGEWDALMKESYESVRVTSAP